MASEHWSLPAHSLNEIDATEAGRDRVIHFQMDDRGAPDHLFTAPALSGQRG
jgi:hypothetical protein